MQINRISIIDPETGSVRETQTVPGDQDAINSWLRERVRRVSHDENYRVMPEGETPYECTRRRLLANKYLLES